MMELRNLAWNELCTTMCGTTTKMNAYFVPRFFICLQLVSPHACSTSRFSLSFFLRHGYKKYLEMEEV